MANERVGPDAAPTSPPARRASLPVRVCSALAVPALLGACIGSATRAPDQTVVLQQIGEAELTSRRVRLAADNVVQLYLGAVELAADSIMRATRSPDVRRHALAWKANAVPAILRAMHQSDPLVSYVDGWVLFEQMRDYVTTGRGSDVFGEEQQIAVETIEGLVTAVRSGVERELSPEVYASLREFVDTWSRERPLDNDLFLRESVAISVIQELSEEPTGGLSAIGSLQEMALDAQQMAQAYLAYTPKVALWQAELMATSVLDSARLSPLLTGVDRMEVSRAATRALDGLPSVIARERRAALAEIDALTEARMEQIVSAAGADIEIMLAALERVAAQERSALMADVEVAVARGLELGRREVIAVVDHLLWRIGLGAVVLLVVLAAGVAVILSRMGYRASA